MKSEFLGYGELLGYIVQLGGIVLVLVALASAGMISLHAGLILGGAAALFVGNVIRKRSLS